MNSIQWIDAGPKFPIGPGLDSIADAAGTLDPFMQDGISENNCRSLEVTIKRRSPNGFLPQVST